MCTSAIKRARVRPEALRVDGEAKAAAERERASAGVALVLYALVRFSVIFDVSARE